MPAIDPTRLQVQEALDRVVASPRFRSSERMSAFLRAPAHAEHGFRLKLNADSGGS
jgi:hypothetical protein